ncbi:MAG: hypothetical protein WA960_18565 [Tunicatimonas sp.]
MSNLEAFVAVCVGVALLGQAWYVRQLRYRLRRFQESVPPPEQLSVQRVSIPTEEFERISAKELAQKYGASQDHPASIGRVIQFSLLQAEANENTLAHRLIVVINSYLVRSRGAVVDFALIRSLAERNVAVNRDSLRYQAWIPLLIGLAAVLLGSTAGLLFLPNLPAALIDRLALASTATLFLTSVKWTALPMLTGGLFMLFWGGWAYPRARREVLYRKNELFSLIQTELLPSLYQDTTHSLQLLQTSLTSFQHGFADSIASLRGMLDRNFDTLKAQERIAEALQKVDVMQLTNANVDMFETLNQSGDELRKFRDYLTEMNHFVENTTALNEKVNHFLYRTDHLETIAEKIKQTLDQNDRLHHFIASHFSELESRGHLIQQAVVKVDDVLDKSLGELMEHTQHTIRAIRDLSAQEENQLLKTYEENKHVFGKLARIDDLNRNFADYKTQNLETQQQVLEQLQTLNQHLTKEGNGGFFKKLFGS